MHLEILVEEPSAKAALDILVPKIVGEEHSFKVISFRGKQNLLSEIPKRLRGYKKWMPDDWRIMVLVDEDRKDCQELKARLVRAASEAGIEQKVLNRIIVEELEAWFFGDFAALRKVYPRVPSTLPKRRKFRDPDRIPEGTWEALDRVLRNAGYRGGLLKTVNAAKVAECMDPWRNTSQSFCTFRDGLLRLVGQTVDPNQRLQVTAGKVKTQARITTYRIRQNRT